MKRARFLSFLVVGAIVLAAVAFWKNPGRLPLIADVVAGPAAENEWVPPPDPVAQPAQPSNPTNAAPSNPSAKSDLSLPPEPKSLNLNSSEVKAADPPVEPLILPATQSEAPVVPPPEPDDKPKVPAPTIQPPVSTAAPAAPATSPEPLIVPATELVAPQADKAPIVAPEELAPTIEKVAPPDKPVLLPVDEPLPPQAVVPSADVKPMAQPGETTMNPSRSVMAAILGAAMLAAPASAEDAKDKDVAKTVEELKAVVKKLEDLEKAQSAYKTTNETVIKQIRDDANALKMKLDQMELDMKTLRQAVNTPQQPLPSGPVTSKRESAANVTQKMGRVKLVNDYNEEMAFVVNGGPSYQLLPGQSRTVSVPAGTFTYQIPQLQSTVQERSIGANEDKTIRVYPRP